MESYSPEWHSESEFYYPDEIDENVNTENTNKSMKRPTNSSSDINDI